jgi:hypothetical protein
VIGGAVEADMVGGGVCGEWVKEEDVCGEMDEMV